MPDNIKKTIRELRDIRTELERMGWPFAIFDSMPYERLQFLLRQRDRLVDRLHEQRSEFFGWNNKISYV